MTTSAYDRLTRHNQRNYHLAHAMQMLYWDSATMMPRKGSESRGQALAELEGLVHGFNASPEFATLLDEAAKETLDDLQHANLREARREWAQANAVPAELLEQRNLAASRCEHAWRSQRHVNDWPGFLANFKPLLALVREEAGHLAAAQGIGRYDALLDKYEPGLRDAEVARVFSDLRQWLPGMIEQIRQRQAGDALIPLQGSFPVAAQKALCQEVMARLGFDFEAGRLDVSSHPFCGGTFEDIRLTTRYDEHDLLQGLSATIHETGHALYNMGLPTVWRGQPLGLPLWGAMHESQALCYEKQLGFSPAFIAWLSPLLTKHFGSQPGFAPDNLAKLFLRVTPSFIRVDADEATYPIHVILRYEIERGLIEGEIEAEDVPSLWNAKMAELLGIDPGAEHGKGCLQDMHWATGLIGYFPGYLLGSMYAAQWFATIRRQYPTIDQNILAGDFGAMRDWLIENVHRHGRCYSAQELVLRATGEALNPEYFRRHLAARYLTV